MRRGRIQLEVHHHNILVSCLCTPCDMYFVRSESAESCLTQVQICLIINVDSPLRACSFSERCLHTHAIAQQSGLSYHNPVVDTKSAPECKLLENQDNIRESAPFISSKDVPSAFPSHDAHHLLKALVTCEAGFSVTVLSLFRTEIQHTADATHNEHLLAADVCHSALGDLYQHGEHRLL